MDKILKQFGFDKIQEIVNFSNSFVDVTKKLGYDPIVGHIKKNVERTIKRLGISTEHFESVQRIKNSKIRYNKEILEKLVDKCNSYKEILEELDLLPVTTNYNSLKSHLNKLGIDYTKLKNNRIQPIKNIWLKENLEKIIKESNTQKDVLDKMGIRSAGGNFGTLRKYIKLYNLDTSHFIKNYYVMAEFGHKQMIPLNDILIENSKYSLSLIHI